jgi:hypothetical protein
MPDNTPDSLREVPLPDNEQLLELMAAEAERLAADGRGREREVIENALFGAVVERNEVGRVLVVIGRKSVERGSRRILEDGLERVMQDSFKEHGFGRLLQFTTDGYTADARPLWEIPEVVAYFNQLHEQKPHLVYWMGIECIPLYCLILAGQSAEKLEKLLLDIFASGNFICEQTYQTLLPDEPARAAQLSEDLIREASRRIESAFSKTS